MKEKINYKIKYLILISIINIIFIFNIVFASNNIDEDRMIVEKINLFKNTYIKNDMTDFEKEIKIIQYIVENVHYDTRYEKSFITIPKESYTAYGALINGEAVCQGYAELFYEMCLSCGLMVNKITGQAYNKGTWGSHMWNQIKLDNEWYNVDVTFEDPISNDNLYGFTNLYNKYINITDMQCRKDHKWSGGEICTSSKYDNKVVTCYLMTHIINTNITNDELILMAINDYKIDNTKLGYDGIYSEISNDLSMFANMRGKFSKNANYFIVEENSLNNAEKEKLKQYLNIFFKAKCKIIPIIFDKKGINTLYFRKNNIIEELAQENWQKYYTIHIDNKEDDDIWFICYKYD